MSHIIGWELHAYFREIFLNCAFGFRGLGCDLTFCISIKLLPGASIDDFGIQFDFKITIGIYELNQNRSLGPHSSLHLLLPRGFPGFIE